MFAMIWVTTMFSSGAEAELEGWLTRPILEPFETRRQLERFVKRRIPPLTAPDTPDAWTQRSRELREQVLNNVILRGVPPEWTSSELGVEWRDNMQTGQGYRIRKLRYEALPGLWIPALLYEPEAIGDKVSAVLNVNGHEYDTGKATGYEQVRCINLAKRGMLALHPEWLNCGELRGTGYEHNRQAYLNLCGTSGVAVFYLAMKRGLDVLASYPAADPERLAMTGLSGGGWQTIILSALDPRIALSVPNAGYIGIAERTQFIQDIGDLEQVPPDLAAVVDYTHLTAVLTPRPALLLYNEKDDCCFQAARAKASVYDPVKPFFHLTGNGGDFLFHENTDPGTHNYERDNREQFYRFVNEQFVPESAWVNHDLPCEGEVLAPEELHVGVPEDNATFISLAESLMAGLSGDARPADGADELAWQENRRRLLRDVLRFRPLQATGAIIGEQTKGGLRAAWCKLAIGEEWCVPARVITDAKAPVTSTIVAFADTGWESLASTLLDAVRAGARVIAVDPLFLGECAPAEEGEAPRLAMLIDTVGERLLGQQVAQVAAIVDWARREFACERVTLQACGWNAGYVALACRALAPGGVEQVDLDQMPKTLKELIEKRLPYEHHPALFCFGLLREFDVPQLIALCAPRPVRREL